MGSYGYTRSSLRVHPLPGACPCPLSHHGHRCGYSSGSPEAVTLTLSDHRTVSAGRSTTCRYETTCTSGGSLRAPGVIFRRVTRHPPHLSGGAKNYQPYLHKHREAT